MYLDIALVTTKVNDLTFLNKKIESALRLEGLNWGAARLHVLRTDPSIEVVTKKFHKTEFAGIVWANNIKQLYTCKYLLYVCTTKDKDTFIRLKKKFKCLKRSKFLNTNNLD